jgi:hypothetical protein
MNMCTASWLRKKLAENLRLGARERGIVMNVMKKMNKGAIEDPTKDRLGDQERKAAACCVVDRCCREGDHEMEEEAKRGRLLPAAKAGFAECTAGYELEQAFECAASREKENSRTDYVQHTADCAGKNNYGERRQGVPHFAKRQTSASGLDAPTRRKGLYLL